MLVDNVTGEFQSSELADLITRKDISGIPPYGRGEEVRPNNLIFVITANSATVAHDIADRSFYIHLCKPEIDVHDRATWKERVQSYILNNRLQIVADVIDILKAHKPFSMTPRTRFAAFETAILQPICGDEKTYKSVCDVLKEAKEESNIEQEQARAIADVIEWNIERITMSKIKCPIFLATALVNSWGGQALKESHDFRGKPVQLIHNLAKAGFLPQVDKKLRRWPRSSSRERVSGIAWNFTDTTEECKVLSRGGDMETKEEWM